MSNVNDEKAWRKSSAAGVKHAYEVTPFGRRRTRSTTSALRSVAGFVGTPILAAYRRLRRGSREKP